jgi:hypothetical protein
MEGLAEGKTFNIYRDPQDGYPVFIVSPKGENQYELWTYPGLNHEYTGFAQEFVGIIKKFKKEGFLIEAL